MSNTRIGIDIGGTFTDLCIVEDDGTTWTTKLLTTPADPSDGFLKILQRALQARPTARDTSEIVHATTIATNAILEHNTARMGLITTRGFRDVLEIGRHFRRDIYNLRLQKPPVLIPRQRRLEVTERIASDGSIVVALERDEVTRAIEELIEDQVEVILVCFLNSYVNPAHEQTVAEMVSAHSDVRVITSHQVCGEYREYERFSTAMVHGAVMPTVSRYLWRIQKQLSDLNFSAPLSVMQSHGGMASAEAMIECPGGMLESGPAAGVMAVAELGSRLQQPHLISLDMGGTTTKATLLENGKVTIDNDYEVGGGIQGGFGTGYPFRMPVVDLVEIGTGGGSLAHVDDVGQLHVGPRSAGAEPGPVCYGRGGTQPTITDADAVLGRLCPENFAGGQLVLDVSAARKAIEKQIAEPLGMTVVEAAAGIVAVANAQMVHALELVSVERGYDPRQFVLVAFGGAGPMHAVDLAKELGCPWVIVPVEAGVQSAWGLLVADARREAATTIPQTFGGVNLSRLRDDFLTLVGKARDELRKTGFQESQIREELAIDVRYSGQAYEVNVPLDDVPTFDVTMQHRITELFHDRHQRLFGHSHPDLETQWVTLRATVWGKVSRPAALSLSPSSTPLSSRVLMTQPMAFAGRTIASSVYDRTHLGVGDCIEGPALIVQADTSIVVPPGVRAEVRSMGEIFLSVDVESS